LRIADVDGKLLGGFEGGFGSGDGIDLVKLIFLPDGEIGGDLVGETGQMLCKDCTSWLRLFWYFCMLRPSRLELSLGWSAGLCCTADLCTNWTLTSSTSSVSCRFLLFRPSIFLLSLGRLTILKLHQVRLLAHFILPSRGTVFPDEPCHAASNSSYCESSFLKGTRCSLALCGDRVWMERGEEVWTWTGF